MTLEEVLKQINGDSKSDSHITYEEAKLAYDSDEKLRKSVNEQFKRLWKTPLLYLLAFKAYHIGISEDDFAKTVMRAVVEALLTKNEQ